MFFLVKDNETWNRDEMYTGRLIRLGIPFRKLPDYNELDISKCMMKYGYADCRKMLFSINESEKTSDVLFTSPSYPICDRMKIIKPEDILIEEKVYLRNTLIYLGFGEKLTRRDINRLYGMLMKRCNNLPDIMEQVAIDRYNLSKAMVNNKEKIGEPKAAFKDMVVSVSMGMIQITPNTLPSIRGIKLDPNTILPTDEELRILSNLSALDPYPSVYEQEGIKKKVKGVWL